MKSDRFIPNSIQKERSMFTPFYLNENKSKLDNDPKVTKLYRMLVLNQPGGSSDQNCQQVKSMKLVTDDGDTSYEYLAKLGIDISKIYLGPTIINKPDRILEALSLSDNFYLNLLDCSTEAILAVGLSRGVYLWKPSGAISRIREAPDISCLQWNPIRPQFIACGSKSGSVQVWDIQKNANMKTFHCHQGRVGSMAWFNDSYGLLSGSKDCGIQAYDLRMSKRTTRYKFHDQQICSLKVQPMGVSAGSETFASGSNDKNLIVWNTRMRTPQLVYKHTAAVKGVAWHPAKSGLLTSGGGTDDRSIKIWNTSSNELVKTVDTGSQVCSLMYIRDGDSLVSSHGFNKFETNIWDSSTMTKKQTLVGHSKRVLYLTAEPDGQTIITGAGDQTIRFWKLKEDRKKECRPDIEDSIMTIR